MAHWSSCSINNGPALPVGDCDCGNDAVGGADGYVSSLRQMADCNYVDFDELRDAADYIEYQQAEIERLQDLCK